MELKELLKDILKPSLIDEVEQILNSAKNLKELQLNLYYKLADKVKVNPTAIQIARNVLKEIQDEYIRNNTPVHLIPRNIKLTKTYRMQEKWKYLIEIIGIKKFILLLPLFKEYKYQDREGNERTKILIPASLIQDKKPKTKEKSTTKDKIKSVLF